VHIGLCSPSWPPGVEANGVVTYVSAIREHFVARGHRVSIFSQGRLIGSGGEERECGLVERERNPMAQLVQRVRRRVDGSRGHLPEIGRQIAAQVQVTQRADPLDILEMEESCGWPEIVQRMTGVPVVTRLHGPHFLKPGPRRSRGEQRSIRERCRAEGRAVRSARALTAPTRATLAVTCAEYGRAAGGISAVIANPVPAALPGQRWRLSRCDPDHILMVGRFDHVKGADTMLMAFEQLLERRPSARLTLVGPDIGFELTPGHTMGFEAYARACLAPQTRERVTFTGHLSPDRIAELRLTARVTVVASRWENFPYALVEGLAAGSPMISTGLAAKRS
jgi:glycosyltransferase involved in cell wall biosynthesis